MNQRDGPGPRSLVDRGIEPELGEIERGRLQRQGNVDRGVALIDGEPDIDAGRDARPYPDDAAIGAAAIADEVAQRTGRGRQSVTLCPAAEPGRLRALGSAAAARIASHRLAEAGRRLDCPGAPENCCRGWSRSNWPRNWNWSPSASGLALDLASGLGSAKGLGSVSGWVTGPAPATQRRRREAQAIASTRTSEVRPNLRPGPRLICLPTQWAAHEVQSEKERQLGKIPKIPIGPSRFALSSPGASIGQVAPHRPIARRCCSAATAGPGQSRSSTRFPEPRQRLASAKISCCNIGYNRI